MLAAAPHLAKLSAASKSDPHLDATQKLQSVFSPEKVQDMIISEAQLAPLAEPLPHSIWQKILQDQFVDFEKLFASMDRGYDHNNEPKDFAADFFF